MLILKNAHDSIKKLNFVKNQKGARIIMFLNLGLKIDYFTLILKTTTPHIAETAVGRPFRYIIR